MTVREALNSKVKRARGLWNCGGGLTVLGFATMVVTGTFFHQDTGQIIGWVLFVIGFITVFVGTMLYLRIRCPKCGKPFIILNPAKLARDVKFCPSCGVSLDDEISPQSNAKKPDGDE